MTPGRRVDFGQSVPNNFTFSPDGKYLYGSSYYTGVSNIFRYEIATKSIEGVSNTDSGFMRPIPLGDGRLVVFRYTGRWFIPAMVDATVVKDIVSNLRLVGYDHVLSIEHEDSIMSPAEGLKKAIAFLQEIVIAEPAGEAYWA